MPAPSRPPDAPVLTAADHDRLASIIRAGSRSFHAASLLLPGRVRRPALALYAFCRLSDDLVDQSTGGAAALDRLKQRLDRIYRGVPEATLADRGFADVVAAHAIPRGVPEALLEGFEWDVAGRRYDTLADLNAYGARVAGTVGVMMAMVMGERRAAVLARAGELGLAMQLTNIARDVGEDARSGRLYLPRQWMLAEGVDPDGFLARPVHSAGVSQVVARLLSEAGELYRRAETGIAALPLDCRPAIRSAARIYAEIGRQIAAMGYDTVSRRAVTSSRRKASLVGQSLAATGAELIRRPACDDGPGPEAIGFLVAQTAQLPVDAEGHEGIPWLAGRILRFVDLLAAIEQRNRDTRALRRTVGQVDTCTPISR